MNKPAKPPVCALTGTPMRPWLRVARDWRRPRDTRGWDLWWSDAGDYGIVHPRPALTDVPDFYDMDALPTAVEHGGLLPRLLVALSYRLDRGLEPTDAFWRDLLPAGAKSAVELGCGIGDRLMSLAPLVETCEGVEPDRPSRDRARSRGFEVHDGTAEAIPAAVAGRRFDFVLFTHVLEHCTDPELALQNAVGLMDDNAVMLLETPNNAALGLRQQGPAWRWLDVPRHLNFFTERSLRAFARRAGLEVERAEYWGYCRQFAPDWLDAQARIAAIQSGREVGAADRHRQEWKALPLLMRSALARPALKYDSVRLICRKAGTSAARAG